MTSHKSADGDGIEGISPVFFFFFFFFFCCTVFHQSFLTDPSRRNGRRIAIPILRAKEERLKKAGIERTYNCWEIENSVGSGPINPATPCENVGRSARLGTENDGPFDFCVDPRDTHFRSIGTNEANFTSRFRSLFVLFVSSNDRSKILSALSVREKLLYDIYFLNF